MGELKLGVEEVSARKGVANSTVRRWLASGQMEGYREETKAGRIVWKIPESSLEKAEDLGYREECGLCDNRSGRYCKAFKDINDPIVGEDGRCIASS